MKYNILLADDHKLFLDGLIRLIEQDASLQVAYYAYNGAYIARYIDSHQEEKIDLVIADISMPEMDGIALTLYVKERRPDTKVLIVSMHTDVSMIDTLVQHDVDGYLSKNTSSEEFIKAIHSILKGEKYFADSVKQAYVDSVFKKEKATLEILSGREKDVLKLIAQEYTTQEIADQLFLSKHTIESYRKTLLAKLKVRNLAGLTKFAIKLGLID